MVATNKNMIYYPSTGFPWAKAGNTSKLFLLTVAKQNYTHIFYKIVEKKYYHRLSIYKLDAALCTFLKLPSQNPPCF